MTMTTTTAHDANGFPIDLPSEVTFSMEESDCWDCSVCEEEIHGDVDDAGHRYDGPTATQIWTACPLEGDGDGDVFTGTFADALAHFTESFGESDTEELSA